MSACGRMKSGMLGCGFGIRNHVDQRLPMSAGVDRSTILLGISSEHVCTCPPKSFSSDLVNMGRGMGTPVGRRVYGEGYSPAVGANNQQ